MIYTILFLFSTVTLSSQLKINSDGSAWQGYSGYANITLGTEHTEGYDNGEWGIEVYQGGLNFWKPWPSTNNGNYKLFIAQNGNVGIGKVPSAKLDVAGSIAIYGSVKISSDERLKDNIINLSEGDVEKLYQLSAKSYTKHQPQESPQAIPMNLGERNANPAKNFGPSANVHPPTNEYGFLAQELKNIYPDLVTQDSAGYYMVDYIGLIPILVEALKVQKELIDVLYSQMDCMNSQSPQRTSSSSNSTANTESDNNDDTHAPIGTYSSTHTDILNYPTLDQNSPNPFTTATEISFFLPISTESASLHIYNMSGEQLKYYPIMQRGEGSIQVQAHEFKAGMYLYALMADKKVVDTKRMILTQ